MPFSMTFKRFGLVAPNSRDTIFMTPYKINQYGTFHILGTGFE